jgi:hypothetical protein
MTTKQGAATKPKISKRSGQALAYMTLEQMEPFHSRKAGMVEMKPGRILQ